MKDKIAFLVAIGNRIGTGHYRRMWNVNKYFRSKGVQTLFFAVSEVNSTQLEHEVMQLDELGQLKDHLIENKVEKIIIDIPALYYYDPIFTTIRSLGVQITWINDSAEARIQAGEKLISCSLNFDSQQSDDYVFYGLKYVILNPLISELASTQRMIQPKIKKVLVSFGGTDPNGITLRLLNLLDGMKGIWDNNLEIDVILGSSNIDLSSLHTDKFPYKMYVHQYIQDMAGKLLSSDLAFISGGMTMYEACSLGTPSIIINQNSEQNDEAASFHNRGAVYNLGSYNQLNAVSLHDAITHIQGQTIREQMSKEAKSLIDGKGIERIFQIV
ncbi:glycosyltransferase [Paenibacillus sp. HJGM_3]|uniref:glycosyltransferase n=1 Tax=Paenibacillus sp. HJGM_3 TaxID=3379816 RepID=UPI003859E399